MHHRIGDKISDDLVVSLENVIRQFEQCGVGSTGDGERWNIGVTTSIVFAGFRNVFNNRVGAIKR
jgi:hypothetical protein